MSVFVYRKLIPGTSFQILAVEGTDPEAWEPLDRCAGEACGVYRSVHLVILDPETEQDAESFCDAVFTEGDCEIGFQADPDRGEWDAPADLLAKIKANSKAIRWAVLVACNRLGAALLPGAREAVEQQKKEAKSC